MSPLILEETLEHLYEKYNKREFVHPDPLEFLYEYNNLRDREIAGLLASSLAYGRVSQILKSVSNVLEKMREDFSSCMDWFDEQFQNAIKTCNNHEYNIDIHRGDVGKLKSLLLNKRHFMVTLLQNPTLLEHDTFSDLLWAVFHLTEELAHRKDLRNLKDADYEHIANDMKRAYVLLTAEWLAYMKHLKDNYPYVFSLAMRTNPFDPDASPEVE